jgi:hypothetical protein
VTKRSGKVRRTARYRYLVADPDEARAAGLRDVEEARLAELRARDTSEHPAADRRRKAAEKALEEAVEACYGTIVLQALKPSVQQEFDQQFAERRQAFDASVKAAQEAEETPPTFEPTWDADSLEVRFLAACDVDAAHTSKWWAEEFAGDEWTMPERDELLEMAFRLNTSRQAFDLGVLGKG